jgi:uncharacterized protein YbgA (DUF1722 family)
MILNHEITRRLLIAIEQEAARQLGRSETNMTALELERLVRIFRARLVEREIIGQSKED